MNRSDRPGDIAAARAADQAASRQRRLVQDARLREHFGETIPGRSLVAVDVAATVVMIVATVAGVVDYRRFAFGAAAVDLAIFAIGVALFAAALWLGAQRSREAEMDVAAWFFLTRVAPTQIRVPLLGVLAVQVVVSLGAAFLTMDEATAVGDQATKLAFGTLVPIFGLAVNGVWSARYGAFPPRAPEPRRGSRATR